MQAPVENADPHHTLMAKEKQNIIFAFLLPLLRCYPALPGRFSLDRLALFQFLDTCSLAVVSTLGPNGAPQSALVGVAVTPDLEMVFDTVAKSRKFANLRRDSRVSLVAGWQGEITVQYEGTARQISSSELGPYHQVYFRKFPDGPARLKWEGIAYFVLTPRWIRYNDYNQSPPKIVEFTCGKP